MQIPSQQSIALALDPPRVQNLQATIHSANLRISNPLYSHRIHQGSGLTSYNSQCESRVSNPLHLHRIHQRFITYGLQFIQRISSQKSIELTPDPLEWGLTFYNSQCESRVSNLLQSHGLYLGFRTYLLYFTVRILSQQSIVLAPASCSRTGSLDLHSTIHSMNLGSAIHCTGTESTLVGLRPLTPYNSHCESLSDPPHPLE